jgi:hypothetical protein
MIIQREMLQQFLSLVLRLSPRSILRRRLWWLNHQQSFPRKIFPLLLQSV